MPPSCRRRSSSSGRPAAAPTFRFARSLKVHPRISFSKPKETHFFIRCDAALDDDELRRAYLGTVPSGRSGASSGDRRRFGVIPLQSSGDRVGAALRPARPGSWFWYATLWTWCQLLPRPHGLHARRRRRRLRCGLVAAGATRCGRRHAQALPGYLAFCSTARSAGSGSMSSACSRTSPVVSAAWWSLVRRLHQIAREPSFAACSTSSGSRLRTKSRCGSRRRTAASSRRGCSGS